MKSQMKEGEGFNYGTGSVRSKAAKQYRTLAQIQADRGKIIPESDMKALKEKLDNELIALADEVMPSRKSQVDGFGRLDAFSDDLVALAQGDFQWIREQYANAPQAVEKMRAFLETLRNAPTEYFEAKLKRAVQINEFSAAVISTTAPAELRSLLEKRGLTVETYDKNAPGDRKRVLQQLARNQKPDVLFKRGPTQPAAVKVGANPAEIRREVARQTKGLKGVNVRVMTAEMAQNLFKATGQKALASEKFGAWEGFYYQGEAVIVSDGIAVRDGETLADAVSRVIWHEGLWHKGLALLEANDQAFREKFNRLARTVLADELDALTAKEYPQYKDWRKDRKQLIGAVEELGAKTAENFGARPVWRVILDAMLDALNRLTNGAKWVRDLRKLSGQDKRYQAVADLLFAGKRAFRELAAEEEAARAGGASCSCATAPSGGSPMS
jgi:hypothetical protein